MQHNLEQLGPYGFEDLAGALAIARFGPHVQVLGPGRDGGRDMYTNSPLIWSGSDTGPGEVWQGYTVFQVKHKARVESEPRRNAEWLWNRIRKELEEWADPESNREKVPNYFVVITNVSLTPTPGSGGEAIVNNNITNFIASFDDDSRDVSEAARRQRLARRVRLGRIRQWRIWDGTQIDALLTVHDGVRRAFKGFLTAPDVFASLAQFTDKLPLDELGPGLHRHARTALIGERAIYFDEAGSGDTAGTPIDQVAVDLPITPGPDGQMRTVVRYVLERAEHVLRPSLTMIDGPRHIVIAGGPGNGKTTMSKFLVQVYRAALLEGDPELGSEHRAAVQGTRETLRLLGRPGLPTHRRWPMRIDLAEYAKEEGLSEDSTLLRWIAHKVTKRSNVGSVSAGALMSWMRQWPWLLVLDGLDEVTEPQTRKRLISQITEFVSDAESDNCDVLAVVTTRPMGYVENIAPHHFGRIDLARLSTAEALAYGIKATQVRLKNDVDKTERVTADLRRAAENEALRNLMQTPLQVLIMTIIVEGAGRLSPDRYSLFYGYYDTVFRRERSKPIPFARLLQEHGAHILDLHQRVGFELQKSSETSAGATAAITIDDLKAIAWNILKEAGFEPSTTDATLLETIVIAATHRLVLLAPHGDDGLGFDVRSLQELMAARFLATGDLAAVMARLRVAAPSPHWRNVWLFTAGQLFSEPQPHRHERLVSLVETIDDDAEDRLGAVCPIGPALALDLVDDGMARAQPRFFGRLLRRGFQLLNMPAPADPITVARALIRAADISDQTRGLVADALRAGLAADDVSRATTLKIQECLVPAAGEAGVGRRAKGLNTIRGKRPRPAPPPDQDSWQDYGEILEQLAPSEPTLEGILRDADRAIRGLRTVDDAYKAAPAIELALRDRELASILEMAVAQIARANPRLVALMRDEVLPSIFRAPIGERLSAPR
ncbi:NACHT domain-containing protein [Mycolicibacterium gadium]|uniref:NACHT domain-containing protein n=1 Tax=Mycolicibacterium gadium TaxID=1794 RepID=A0ABT6GKS7_MYCGU|nr:hypothetical protein [Mycolicibacterium gadium]MDG5481987.1 hypothetical protein [Mycolicibacterium gadium]